jgi:hypothetical protein
MLHPHRAAIINLIDKTTYRGYGQIIVHHFLVLVAAQKKVGGKCAQFGAGGELAQSGKNVFGAAIVSPLSN